GYRGGRGHRDHRHALVAREPTDDHRARRPPVRLRDRAPAHRDTAVPRPGRRPDPPLSADPTHAVPQPRRSAWPGLHPVPPGRRAGRAHRGAVYQKRAAAASPWQWIVSPPLLPSMPGELTPPDRGRPPDLSGRAMPEESRVHLVGPGPGPVAGGLSVMVTSVSSDSHTWNLVFLQLALEELGHRVVNLGACVPDELVLAGCLRVRPDLVVVSSVNGHGFRDGTRLIGRIRGCPELAATPVVIG